MTVESYLNEDTEADCTGRVKPELVQVRRTMVEGCGDIGLRVGAIYIKETMGLEQGVFRRKCACVHQWV